MPAGKNVLSIQSHVTHGYVGNKAATFPLQLHGFDVDGVNTVSLSNHSGYPVIRGHRMDLEEFNTILDGLRANGFLPGYSHILTGYINNVDIVRHVAATVAEVRELRKKAGESDVAFFCDPVLGDDGKLYCKEEVVEAYRELVAHADVATPNYFEASLLSNVQVQDMPSAVQAADWFHAQGTATVIIKSFALKEDPTHLHFLLSCRDKASGATKRYTGVVPYHEGRYTGTGDVFAAALLAFCHTDPIDVAVGKAMGVMQDLIVATIKRGGSGEATLNSRELRVTDHPQSLLQPTAVFPLTLLS
ncbi:putative Pyridoxal kinase [Leptomonas pyrrhocoris]|uniref:pyridoxal kinase n=1 Tax=Leptomonas pyrrhocoris TaxID=157538 RepID=A0A0M9G630_LEPPY|nr:putative Pyridoxal kinase [Leptomonas pyrrhocoris]KPA83143.1 putative Pyridoxal kinase [Leptomonas pyrrhocoris]|eukprot:XP_015661582.1 putative Pyridoxal kinase [Leptomonas pyrrhocoris]